jgi:FtsH-binding integral membrane protein
MDRFPRSDSIVQQTRSGLQTYMAQVYGWMTVGLLLTAFIAWYAANTPELMMFIFSSKITFFGLIIAQLALVFVLSGLVQAECRHGDHAVYALFGANGADAFQYFHRLHLPPSPAPSWSPAGCLVR